MAPKENIMNRKERQIINVDSILTIPLKMDSMKLQLPGPRYSKRP